MTIGEKDKLFRKEYDEVRTRVEMVAMDYESLGIGWEGEWHSCYEGTQDNYKGVKK